jgi:hypothetical protein
LNTTARKPRKEFLLEALQKRDWKGLQDFALHNRGVIRNLLAYLFHQRPLIRWRAIEALGKISPQLAEANPESVRNLLRQLLWTMNDESGNSSPYAPCAIGEILFNLSALSEEYLPLLLSYRREEYFTPGVLWAVARLSEAKPELFAPISDDLISFLHRDNPAIRAYSAIALNNIEGKRFKKQIDELFQDEGMVEFYHFESGELERTKVKKIIASLKI